MLISLLLGEKQAATHISLDQEYDSESSQQWKELEEQVVAVANKGIIPSNFQPTQYCLNSYSDNSRFPLAVVEGKMMMCELLNLQVVRYSKRSLNFTVTNGSCMCDIAYLSGKLSRSIFQ